MKNDLPVPDSILQLPKDKPIVFFAMGCSGKPEVIIKILKGFKNKPYKVIAPVKHILIDREIEFPENIIITDLLPALKINKIADITLIHGGIGTVMTAVLSGKPIIGVPMRLEQESNINCLVKKGFAIKLNRKTLSPKKINSVIEKILNNQDMAKKAKEYQQVAESWYNSERVLNFFLNTFN